MGSSDIYKITAEQMRAARAMLRMSAQELANAAKIGVATVRRSEAESGPVSATAANAAAIQAALEAAGIEFIPENGGGAGVRLRLHKSPYDYFPFPIFDVGMPFGLGRFGVIRTDHNFNEWHNLKLVQLADPKRAFPDPFEIWPFWIETMNTENVLETVLAKALDAASGPRKPKHPSELGWWIIQPSNVYPSAREFVARLEIDWQNSPPQIIPNRSHSTFSPNFPSAVRDSLRTRLIGLEWWRLDEAREQRS